MNLGEMETALKRYGFDAGDPLAIWINAAMHELEGENDWPFLEQPPFAFNATVGVSTYNPVATGFKIYTLRDVDNQRKLVYYDRHKFARDIADTTERGLPEIYTFAGEKIQLWRVPEKTIAMEMVFQGAALDMKVAADEPTTVGSEAIVWPKDTHYPIVLLAASIALMAENEEERSKVAKAEYEKALMGLKAGYGERELDEPATVQDVQGYGTEGYARVY